MITEIRLPELGDGIESALVVAVAVSVGDTISTGQTIIEVETDKAVAEVPSNAAGVVTEILIKEGDDVQVDLVLLKIETASEVTESVEDKASQTKSVLNTVTEVEAVKAEVISKSDTVTPPAKEVVAPLIEPRQAATAGISVAAAPSVRRFSYEIGININQVPGTGAHGRISTEDVKSYSKSLNQGGASLAKAGVGKPLPDFSPWGEVRRESMSGVRKATANHLTHAWQTIPHVTQGDRANITNLEALRKQYKKVNPESRLTLTVILVKVVALAMKKYPQFNSSVDLANQDIIYKDYTNIGVAVDTPQGLLVPVIKNVNGKNIVQLTEELTVLAGKARERKLGIADMQGGCFTISNLGGIGGTFFTPIVNWPEVAILGVSKSEVIPVYNKDGELEPQLAMPLSLSYDHRIIDGANAIRFLRYVVSLLENPINIIVEV